ncbi:MULTISPECIES: iron-containing alcohol dehydrogenase [unclassified Achromobacter]|uniref:iron-containing alcohol dehydrogenase n=1 Tax=unclassified Achromobacter TaxID=2626865 RepID=UPI000B517B4B|nr:MULTISPECIES: iron-containing alcohol dehydrogenase [unclassified Achromobacter]OWT71391.1 alcohol dehydrogenase [Achromobacter sp. HZ34]OWT73356.1 alcohol dehydrogenase [Achromobacter sp. HZ28]
MHTSIGVMRAPRSVLFGAGQRRALGKTLSAIGKRVLICTDKRFASSGDMLGILDDLAQNGLSVTVFDGTLAELPLSSIERCVDMMGSAAPHVVVGIGGGSCMDMAKLVSLLLTHGGPIDRYYGEFKVPGPVTPIVAVPTTSGTGSEVTPVAVLADDTRDLKVGISSPYLIPHTAICDPELTMTCPPGLTALSGADALTHAIEAYTAVAHPPTPDLSQERVFVGKNVLSDQFALSAIEALCLYLPQAVRNGSDILARTMVMKGSLLAGLAFGSAGTSLAHAIQYPVGALTNTPHGLGVAVLMPYVMEYNASACQTELTAIGRVIGVDNPDDGAVAKQAIDRIRAFLSDIGIPLTLKDLGLQEEKIDWVAEQSMRSARLINNNPRMLDVDAIGQVVRRAYHGAN